MARARPAARATGLVIGLTIAVLAATGVLLTIVHSNSAAEQQRLVVNNYETMAGMRQALIAVQDAETGERGFLLTGDPAYLEPYEKARLRLDGVLRQLEAATAADTATHAQVGEFRAAAERRLEELNAAIVAIQVSGREVALASERSGAGRATMGRLREIAESFEEGQRLQLARRLSMLRSEQDQADVAGLLVLAGAFLCLMTGMFVIVRGAGSLEDAQRLLAARTSLLQATLETLHDPIFVLDADGAVVAWNRSFAELAGWDTERQPVPTRDVLLSERSPAMRAILAPLKLGESMPEASLTKRASYDGREYEVSRGKMSDGGAVVRCVDVTDRLRDEAALRQGQKMEAIGQLTGGMAHDFNNILQVIQANLDLVRADGTANPAVLERLQSASAAGERGARLTQQLLAFARRQPLAAQPTNVARLVADLADLLRHALGERITLELRIAADPWNARIDAGQLENAILNLAINARDAMPDGGTVRVEVGNATLDRRYAALHQDVVPGSYVLVDVGDTGTGMAADVVARAFDPFFTTKIEGKGTGLGLSMVYGFVQQSNGHIRIDSAIGQGTSVKLYLPRTLDAAAEPEIYVPGAGGGNERVLIVEDNEAVRRVVTDTLSGWGYRVVAAESPDAASMLLDQEPAFDLLFSDVVMPGTMSAVDLALKAERLRPGIAVLLTSGFARDLVPERSRHDYPLITKPYHGDELAGRIRALLAARRATASGMASEPRASALAPEQPSASSRPRRILVVEDEAVLRMSTTDMLEHLDCMVTAVGSGEQAIELLTGSDSFDLLLTDLGLPGMSGQDLAAEVRRRFPDLPVVIASGYGRTGVELPGVQFIAKPYSSVDLEQALDQARRNTIPA
ncbi:MAG: response regulator [Alphaproteobacteria bacterium]|nr:response regulator [Alphaproteobacteria bacterium]